MGLINNNFGGPKRGSRAGGVLSGKSADEAGKAEGAKSVAGTDEPAATKPPVESMASPPPPGPSPVIERPAPKPPRGMPTPARRTDPRDQNEMVKNWPIASDEPKPSRAAPGPAAPVVPRPPVAARAQGEHTPAPQRSSSAPSSAVRESPSPASIVAEAAKAARSPSRAEPRQAAPPDAAVEGERPAPVANRPVAKAPIATRTVVSEAAPATVSVEAVGPKHEAAAAALAGSVRASVAAMPQPVASHDERADAKQIFAELATSSAAAAHSLPAESTSTPPAAEQPMPPGREAASPKDVRPQEVASTEPATEMQFQPVTFGTSQAPAPLEFVLPGLAVGEVGLITEQGHAGAAALISQLVAGVALGRNLIDDRPDRRTPFHPVEAGAVAFVAGDDSAAAIQNRLYQITQALSISSAERLELEQSAVFFSARGHDLRLLSVEGDSGLGFEKVLRTVARGRRLVIIEPLGRLHDADPNNAPVATNLALKLTRIAEECGCAVVVVQHDPNVIPGRSNRAGSAFEAAVRWHLLLRPAPTEELAQIGVRGKQLPKSVVAAQLDTANLPSTLPPAYLFRDPSGTLTTLPERSRSPSTSGAEVASAASAPESKGSAVRGPWGRR